MDTKNMRVSWNHFDRVLACFKNDTRMFLVSDENAEVDDHPMSMYDIIGFWDGGIDTPELRLHMIRILETASSMSLDDEKEVAEWKIRRVA